MNTNREASSKTGLGENVDEFYALAFEEALRRAWEVFEARCGELFPVSSFQWGRWLLVVFRLE
jgi:hypothetical protein